MNEQLNLIANNLFAKGLKDLSETEVFRVLVTLVREESKNIEQVSGNKKLYYLSSEFLMGRLLINNLINLHVYDDVKEVLGACGFDLARIDNLENEPSLGNGGLGRLAACFVDSITSLDLPGEGVGILYHYGLFKQKFINNEQTALPDTWIEEDSLIEKTNIGFEIEFGKFSVNSVLYNVDVLGYNKKKNYLRLFDVKSVDESVVKEGIDFDQTQIAKNLSLFLYPDDSTKEGHLLRIYQQYFIVSNAVQLMLQDNEDINNVEIQINDTHPTLVIPELIYQLDKRGVSFEEALKIIERTTSYTNHTILAEALEKWPVAYLEEVVPHLLVIIKKLDKLTKKYGEDMAIIDEDNRVHMAHICIHFTKSINGVAALHTEILKNSELNNFYKLYPEKFNNKTNGITFRRWLKAANNDLYKLINENVNGDVAADPSDLISLLDQKDNKEFLQKLADIKSNNKVKFAKYLEEKENKFIDTNSIFDIQIKRMHEYKRQQMNALFIIDTYLKIRQGIFPANKVTFIFGAKAAPAYVIAQDIIHLLLTLSELIKKDPVASKYIDILFIENYNVSVAERLIPAADISEQISLASKEASGTGNMKLMLNGAVTLGTLDGANVEISDLVGEENIYIFGKTSDVVIDKYDKGSYNSRDYYIQESIKPLVDFIVNKELMEIGNPTRLRRLFDEFLDKDWFMTLLDIEEYINVKNQVITDYSNQELWMKKVLVNIASSAKFSSDRTIKEYNEEIWKLNV